jgi:hypothetical protein
MIVEAKKIENGFFIPMIDQLKSVEKEYILINIELINAKSENLEKQHKQGYLQYPVTPGEFSDWEDEQAWG